MLELIFDKCNQKVFINGEIKKVSQAELSILLLLVDNEGVVQSKPAIIEAGWPARVVSPSSMPVAITNIRKLLPRNTIITHKDGYYFQHPQIKKIENLKFFPSKLIKLALITLLVLCFLGGGMYIWRGEKRYPYFSTADTIFFSTNIKTLLQFCGGFNCDIKIGRVSMANKMNVVMINNNSNVFTLDVIKKNKMKNIITNNKVKVSRLLLNIDGNSYE